MSGETDPRDELRAAIDALPEDQVQTLLGWLRMLSRERRPAEGQSSVGSLGDALGIVAEPSEPGRSRMSVPVDPAWHNPNGVFHGGVIYTMVDYGMGLAVMNDLPPGEFCATVEVKISYLSPVREGTLTVDTEIIRRGRNLAFTESKVRDEDGKLIATASGSMFILRPSERA